MTVDAQLRTAAEAWLDDDPDERDRAELRALLNSGDRAELADRFAGRLTFGTAGLRGAIGAALLFGFTTQLQSILSSINVPIQSDLLLLTPYVVTIIVVAGLVGKVRGPRAEGVPYIKS